MREIRSSGLMRAEAAGKLAPPLLDPAGTWMWIRGWLFILVIVVASILSTLYLRRVNPDVIAARVNRHEGTKGWDLLLGGIFILPTILAIPIVAALDDGRYHWLPVPWWVCVLGYAPLIIGMVGLTWAESVNKFFEPTVHIQIDRGHRGIDTAPYAVVWHPSYPHPSHDLGHGFFFRTGVRYSGMPFRSMALHPNLNAFS